MDFMDRAERYRGGGVHSGRAVSAVALQQGQLIYHRLSGRCLNKQIKHLECFWFPKE